MARPATRPRATASSYPKPAHDLPTPYSDESSSPAPPRIHYHQPAPTPPYSSTEDLSMPYGMSQYQQPPHGGLMPPPSIIPGQSMPTSHPHSSPLAQQPNTSPAYVGSISPQNLMRSPDNRYPYPDHSPASGSYFTGYGSYYYGDANPYLAHDPNFPPPPGLDYKSSNEEMQNFFNYGPPPITPVAGVSELDDVEGETKSAKPVHTPRPPNAWILYRSDKLKAIAAGSDVPGLDDVMAELGVSSSSDEQDKDADGATTEADGDATKKTKPKKKKAKKGAKEPTEGLLSLGKGKTGRGLPQADISKMISMLWKRESAAVRGEYERQSEMKKAEHAAMYPGYKFQPLRKADKIKLREEKEREKEAARREKDLQKSGGGRRRPRTRARLSPTAPYSVLEGSRGMARSLTYSGHTSTDESFRDGFGHRGSVPTTPGDNFDDHRFRSYPFPMPSSSLPSMGPEDAPISYDAVIPAAPVDVAPQQHSAPAASPAGSYPGQARHVSHGQTSQHASPVPHRQPSRQFSRDLSMPPPPVPSPSDARPYSSAMPEQSSQSSGQYNLEKAFSSFQHDNPEELDAHDIVSLWCTKDDDADPPLTVTQPAPRGQHDEIGNMPRVVQDALDYDGNPESEHAQGEILDKMDPRMVPELSRDTFAEVELRTLAPPSYPGGWIQVPIPQGQVPADPNDRQTHLYAPEDALVFDGNAYAYAPGIGPDGSVDLPVLWAGDESAMGNYAPDASNDFYLAFDHEGPHANGMIPLEAMIVEESGPFLSEPAIMSPTDSEWTLRPTPLNAFTFEPTPTSDDSEHGQTNSYIPRHVSTSAFPITPQSVSGSLPNGWNDRTASFAFANGLQSSFDMGIGEDMIAWDDEEAITSARRVSVKSPVGATGMGRVKTPLTVAAE